MTRNHSTTATPHSSTVPAVLVYAGSVIHARAEMLSLTDMWRAAGEPAGKRPANWARKEGADFIGFLADTLNVPVGHIYAGARGAAGSTFAHWQIALAYAKYLSPEFHMWCNTVVRERMEGPAGGALTTIDHRAIAGVIERVAPEIVRGILAEALPKLAAELLPTMLTAALASRTFIVRRGKTAGQIWRENGFPPCRLTGWFSHKLRAMQCQIEGGGRAELGLTTAHLFDPDKVQAWLGNGGRMLVERKIAEHRGQGRLRFVPVAV